VSAGQWASFSQPNRQTDSSLSLPQLATAEFEVPLIYFLPHSKHTLAALQTPPVNAKRGNDLSLLWESHGNKMHGFWSLKQVVHIVTLMLMLQRANMAWYNNPAEPCSSDTDIMWSGAHRVMIMLIGITNEYLMAHLQVNAHLKGSRLDGDVYRDRCSCHGLTCQRLSRS
jgi:hypothetical protein